MTAQPKRHDFPIRVYYEDTDAGGIVYHSNYLNFAERGRTESLRSLGFDHQRVMKDFGVILIVAHVSIDYRAPARLDDLLNVSTEVTEIGNTSLIMTQLIRRDDQTLAEMKVVVVAVTPDGRPQRFPPQLRQIFQE